MNITSEMVEAFHKAYDASLEMQPRETSQAIYDGLSAALQSAADTPAPSVTREEAIKFLEGACRNWSKVPRLSEDDIGDVATELLRFVGKKIAAPLPPSKVREE